MKCSYCGKEITPTERQKAIAEIGRRIYHPECYRQAMADKSKEHRTKQLMKKRIEQLQHLVLEELEKMPKEIAEVIGEDALEMAELVAVKIRRTKIHPYALPIIKMACEKNGIGYRPYIEPRRLKYLSQVRGVIGISYVSVSRMVSNLIKLIAKRYNLTGEEYRELNATARKLLRLVGEESTSLATAAGIVYLAGLLTDIKITQVDLSELTGMSNVSIRNAYKKIADRLKR